jgi:VanZ family protein
LTSSPTRRQPSSAWWLAAVFAALVVYASLYPFTGWRWPPGGLRDLFALPWPRVRLPFDESSNLLGYLPLGALLSGAVLRSGGRGGLAFGVGALAPALLSLGLEVTQGLLPQRVPSLKDLALNAAGALLGALLAVGLAASGAVQRWQTLRERWFVRQSAAALVLMLLWPLGLLFPQPVPLGLGQVGDELRGWIDAVLVGTPWAGDASRWLPPVSHDGALSPAAEGLAIALGLLAPCLVAFAATRGGRRRLFWVVGALLLAVGVTSLATALNFGPAHAFAWLAPATVAGLLAGAALALAGVPLRRRLAAGLGLVVLTAHIALVAQAPPDPYYAASLQAWEQGRFIRFHGVAQWIGWFWPYAAGLWLLLRLGARDDEGH